MKINTAWNLKKKKVRKIPNAVAQEFEKSPMLVSQMLPFFKGCV